MKIKWTNEEDKQLILLYENGTKIKDIAFGSRTNAACRYRIRLLNLPKRVRRWTQEEKSALKKMYQKKAQYTEIASALGRPIKGTGDMIKKTVKPDRKPRWASGARHTALAIKIKRCRDKKV